MDYCLFTIKLLTRLPARKQISQLNSIVCNVVWYLPYLLESYSSLEKKSSAVESVHPEFHCRMIFGHTRQHLWVALPLLGYFVGKQLDDMETNRMTLYRDKSKLYGGQLKSGDAPSWP